MKSIPETPGLDRRLHMSNPVIDEREFWDNEPNNRADMLSLENNSTNFNNDQPNKIHVSSSDGPSNHRGNSSGDNGFRKRKNIEGVPEQSPESGSSSYFARNGTNFPPHHNLMTSLNISISSDPLPILSAPQPNRGIDTFPSVDFDSHRFVNTTEVEERFPRNSRTRIDPSSEHDGSRDLRISSSLTDVPPGFDRYAPRHLRIGGSSTEGTNSRGTLRNNGFVRTTETMNLVQVSQDLANGSTNTPENVGPAFQSGTSSGAHQSLETILRSFQSKELNDARDLRISSSHTDVPPGFDHYTPRHLRIGGSSTEGTNSRGTGTLRNNGFVPTTETMNLVQVSQDLAGGSTNTPENVGPTFQYGTGSGDHQSLWPVWRPSQSSSYTSTGQSINFTPQQSGESARVRLRRLRPYLRSAGLLEGQMDGDPAVPVETSRERMERIMRIRRMINIMFGHHPPEDGFAFDDAITTWGPRMFDRHRDMRLDVDSMSYEELLALQERIGDVSTGLSEEMVLKCLKQRKFFSIVAPAEVEPCCICLEGYTDGEDVGELECGHDFHTGCIKQWLQRKSSCPVCKTAALANAIVDAT